MREKKKKLKKGREEVTTPDKMDACVCELAAVASLELSLPRSPTVHRRSAVLVCECAA